MHLSTNLKKISMLPIPTLRFYASKIINKLRCGKNRKRYTALNWQEYQRYRTSVLNKLRKKYSAFIKTVKADMLKEDAELPHKKDNVIWIYWAQGFENAPDIVKMCARSVADHLRGGIVLFC